MLKYSLKSKCLLSISLVIIFFFLYGLKYQLGINIFESFSLGSSFPFKYLTNDVIEPPRAGILLSENFDKKKLFRTFSALQMSEKGTVTNELSQNGFNGSRCFWVTNSSSGRWVSSHRKYVKVSKGDHFSMEGSIKMTGEKSRAFLSFAAFDHNKDAIKWTLHRSGTDRTGEWIKLERHFIIHDDNIKYIRLRLVGVGRGEYFFDNIIFRKLELSEQ